MFLSVNREPKATSIDRDCEQTKMSGRRVRGRRTQWVAGKVISDEVGLEKRAHLRVSGTGMVQD